MCFQFCVALLHCLKNCFQYGMKMVKNKVKCTSQVQMISGSTF